MKNSEAPNIKIYGLEIWIIGNQFPESDDYWDGNWLTVSAKCSGIGSEVFVKKTYIHLSEINALIERLENLYSELKGEIDFEFMEPELSLAISSDILGHLSLKIGITPDHLNQMHEYNFEMDQSYIPKIIDDLKNILKEYPIKSKP